MDVMDAVEVDAAGFDWNTFVDVAGCMVGAVDLVLAGLQSRFLIRCVELFIGIMLVFEIRN
jgi:hypothetical protein